MEPHQTISIYLKMEKLSDLWRMKFQKTVKEAVFNQQLEIIKKINSIEFEAHWFRRVFHTFAASFLIYYILPENLMITILLPRNMLKHLLNPMSCFLKQNTN